MEGQDYFRARVGRHPVAGRMADLADDVAEIRSLRIEEDGGSAEAVLNHRPEEAELPGDGVRQAEQVAPEAGAGRSCQVDRQLFRPAHFGAAAYENRRPTATPPARRLFQRRCLESTLHVVDSNPPSRRSWSRERSMIDRNSGFRLKEADSKSLPSRGTMIAIGFPLRVIKRGESPFDSDSSRAC